MDRIGVKRDVTTLKNHISKFINRNKNIVLTCLLVFFIVSTITAGTLLSDTRYTQTTGYIDAEDTIITQDGNIWVTDISSVCTIYASVGDDINVTFDNKGTDNIEDDEVVAISKLEN